jgi:L-lactate dehydrogenase (cytochrome)
LRKKHATPQVYQFYYHRDRGLNRAMMQRAKEAGVEVMMLTVDSITGGNRERDLRTGFSIPFRLTPGGMFQFAIKPMWGINYVTHESFKLPQLDEHVDMSGGAVSIGKYFTEMLDPSMNWDDVAEMVQLWNGQFCLKGIMSVADAKRAVEIGCTVCCPTMAVGSWTAREPHSISWLKSWMPWAIASMWPWTEESSAEPTS